MIDLFNKQNEYAQSDIVSFAGDNNQKIDNQLNMHQLLSQLPNPTFLPIPSPTRQLIKITPNSGISLPPIADSLIKHSNFINVPDHHPFNLKVNYPQKVLRTTDNNPMIPVLKTLENNIQHLDKLNNNEVNKCKIIIY